MKHSMNPFDELAIEEAVRLRERGVKKQSPGVASITAVSAGPAKAADVLRTALAMGADRAIHILVDEPAEGIGGIEPLAVAKLLAQVARNENADLVLMGKQSIDDDACQTGPMLAALLAWPQATQAAQITLTAAAGADADGARTTALVSREVDGGVDTVRASLPVVITADLRLNEPRYASLPNIMKAKKKPLVRTTAAELGVDLTARLRTVRVVEPAPRSAGVRVKDVDSFISKLDELGAL